jgi:hypothetical protein
MAVCKSVTIPGMTGHVRRNTHYELRNDEMDFLNGLKHVHVPDFQGILKKASQKTREELNNIFF